MSFLTLLNTETITVSREDPGVNTEVDGYYVPRARTDILDVPVSIQPMNGQDLLRLPEGDRGRQSVKIYSKFEFLLRDQITRDGIVFEVSPSEDWEKYPPLCSIHFKNIAFKVEDQNAV